MFKKKLHNFPLFFSGMKFIIQNNLIKKRLILMHLSYCYAVINMYNMVKIHINHCFIYVIGNLMQLSSTTIGKSKFGSWFQNVLHSQSNFIFFLFQMNKSIFL